MMLYKNVSFVREGIRAFPDFFMIFSLVKTLFFSRKLGALLVQFHCASERRTITKTALGRADYLCAQVAEVSDNINEKDKENNNNINFTWKEIDDGSKKKSRGGLFSFIKRKTAEFTKSIEKARAEKAAEAAKFAKPVRPAEPAEPVKADEPVESIADAKSEVPAESVEPVKLTEPVEPEKAVEAVKPAEAAKVVEPEKAVQTEKVEEPAKLVQTEKVEEPEKLEKPETQDKLANSSKKAKRGKKGKSKKTDQADKPDKTAKDEKAVQVTEDVVKAETAESDKPVEVEKVDESAEAVVAAESTEVEAPAETETPVEGEDATAPDKPDKPAKKTKKAKSTKKAKKAKKAKLDKSGKPVKRLTKGKVFLGIACLFVAMIVGSFIYAYNSVPSIDPDASTIYTNIDLSSIIYDSKGKEIDKLYYTEDRVVVPIKAIPEVTKNAFIAIEDKTFYKHHGLNYKRLFGAVLSKLTGRSEEISGTSTITQQLARNVFLADIKSERTISRKLREMIYALKIERAYTKDEILEAYLNTIYLGYGCYGINAAAHTYFGKDVQELNLAESAALAALPQAPDSYALLKDEKDENTTYLKKYKLYANEICADRRDLVLDLMQEQGYISSAEAEEATMKIAKILHPDIAKKPKELTYFTDFLTTEVAHDLAEKYHMSEEKAQLLIHTGGLRIYSTIDQDIQNAINTEFSDDYNFPYSMENPQAAMVVTEVGTGRIRAMAGGRNTSGQMLFNRATSPRQPGSSIKPLAVYSAALQKSEDFARRGMPFPFTDFGIDRQGIRRWGNYITAGSVVVDERLKINNEIWPLNFSRRFSGFRTFRTALQQSINTCAVKIQLQVGPEYSMEMLRKFGISTIADDESVPTNDYNPAALALGAMTYGATPLDMALAYATFPNGGVRNSGTAYTKVVNPKGKVLLEKETEETRVLDEGVAFIMRDCLESVVSRGIARSASIYGTQVGGKTGTTNDNYDYWFVGFTPKYSAALWIGTDHNTVMSGSSGNAAYLWSKIMRQVPDITEGEYPPQPENVVYYRGEYYTEKTQP